MEVSVQGYITCKGAEMFADCADNYAVGTTLNKFAISDGVSKSFFPKIWSTILVQHYVNHDTSDVDRFVSECQQAWTSQIDEIISRPETKWFTRVEYNRKTPALATFVGLQFLIEERLWIASALGDSFLFFIPANYTDFKGDLVSLSSKSEPVIFDNFPDYLASVGSQHKGDPKYVRGAPLQNGTFYLMTDALADWFLTKGEDAIHLINVWEGQKDFERFVDLARRDRQLGDDDSAILIIKVSDAETADLNYSVNSLTKLDDLILAEKEEVNHLSAEQTDAEPPFADGNAEASERNPDVEIDPDAEKSGEVLEGQGPPVVQSDPVGEVSPPQLSEKKSFKGLGSILEKF
ncbi:hypothetical protein D0C36_23540 [Mucilaginibacter conchicola]|uniref:Protein phosphatase 2C domain-containing protein n=1 Tax=Mucilaginibacter conchicola TaxID=2303333 RepID=A0A372NM36_9SPHI|nr:hypothetical protein [Mucilaginibacter conchicola]RFZ90004.1 hypothetical protein D0C36_23540 [Mucilaginibacter conchicola]